MNKVRSWEFVSVALVVFALGILSASNASADALVIGISAPTDCGDGGTICYDPTTGTGTLLATGIPYSVAGGEALSISSPGTYLLDNDTGGNSFALTFDDPLPFDEALECQVNGVIDGVEPSCSIAVGSATVSNPYGPPTGLNSGTWSPDATITFSNLLACPTTAADACMFDLTIGTATANAPEPSSFVLLGMGFVGLFGLAYWKSGALHLGFRS